MQLINNILMVKTGDESFCSLKTEGLATIYRTFAQRVQDWQVDGGQRPFRHIKAWYNPLGTLGYVDGTLVHHTPEHPQGVPYSPEELERLRGQFIASRMRMFEDVVYRQFGHLNSPREKEKGGPRVGFLESVSPKR